MSVQTGEPQATQPADREDRDLTLSPSIMGALTPPLALPQGTWHFALKARESRRAEGSLRLGMASGLRVGWGAAQGFLQ